MKQLYNEMNKLYNWCFFCPHSDAHREISENSKNDESFRFKIPSLDSLIAAGILERNESEDKKEEPVNTADLNTTITKTITESLAEIPNPIVVERVGIEKDEWVEWKAWEDSYEYLFRKFSIPSCPYIRRKGLELNVDREFILPDSETEILRLLDKMSQIGPEECEYNRREHLEFGTVTGMMKKAIAKIDFALIERGMDFGKLMHDMYFPYYERKNDIYECGYSWDLVHYYLNKYDIKLLSNEEYDAMDTVAKRPDFKNTVEFQDAFASGQCDENGKLLVKKSEFTRFAHDHFKIKSSYKKFWTRFDHIFVDDKGKSIPYKTFIQSYRDQGLG